MREGMRTGQGSAGGEMWRQRRLQRTMNSQTDTLLGALRVERDWGSTPATTTASPGQRALGEELQGSARQLLHAPSVDGPAAGAAHQPAQKTVIFDHQQDWVPQQAQALPSLNARYCRNCDEWLLPSQKFAHKCPDPPPPAPRPWAFVQGAWVLDPAQEIGLQVKS